MVRVARFAALILSLLTEQAAPPAPGFYANLASPDAQVDVAGAAGLINLYRRNNGLAPLAPDGALAAMARKEAEAMARAGAPASAEALKVRLAAEGVRLPAVNISAITRWPKPSRAGAIRPRTTAPCSMPRRHASASRRLMRPLRSTRSTGC